MGVATPIGYLHLFTRTQVAQLNLTTTPGGPSSHWLIEFTTRVNHCCRQFVFSDLYFTNKHAVPHTQNGHGLLVDISPVDSQSFKS